MAEKKLADEGATESQRKYARTAFDNERADFTAKDQGSAAVVMEGGSTRVLDFISGKGSLKDMLSWLHATSSQMQQQGVYGPEASKAIDYFSNRVRILQQEGLHTLHSSDSALVEMYDTIMGKGLNASQVQERSAWLNKMLYAHQLSESDWRTGKNYLSQPSDPILRQVLVEGKSLFTDKDGKVDTAGLAQWSADLINAREASPTKNADDLKKLGDSAKEARSAAVAALAVSAQGPASRNLWQRLWNVTTADEKNMSTAFASVKDGSMHQAIVSGNHDAARAYNRLFNVSLGTYLREKNLSEIAPNNVLRKFVVNPQTGEQYLMAIHDTSRGGGGAVLVPEWDGTKYVFTKIPPTWEQLGGK